jgi:Putative adhesin
MKITTPSLRITVPCAVLFISALASPVHAEEYSKTYAVTGQTTVRIQADDSSVHVITADTDRVEFRVTSEGFAAVNIGRKLHIDSQQNGNQVELTVRLSPGVTLGINNKRISTEVRMPKNADLQLETSDGHVEVSDLNGNIVVHTSDGAIKASQLSGTIDIRSNDGDISAEALKGTFKLHSGDGKITATQLDGNCNASTRDGPIKVAGRFDSLDVKSGDGAVNARAEPGSKLSTTWSITTADGGVEVAIPKDLPAKLDASTRDGHIFLGLPVSVEGSVDQKAVRGTINGGGPTLLIHTGDGTIHLNGV